MVDRVDASLEHADALSRRVALALQTRKVLAWLVWRFQAPPPRSTYLDAWHRIILSHAGDPLPLADGLICCSSPSVLLISIQQQHYTTMFATTRHTALRQARAALRPTPTVSVSQLSALARLLSSLAVLEQKDGKLNPSSLSAVTAAQKLGGSIIGFIAGGGAKSVAEEAAKVQGLEKIVFVDSAAYDKGLPENWAPLLVENIKKEGITHVLAGHSAFGKNLLPRVAAMLDVAQLSDITGITSEDSMSLLST